MISIMFVAIPTLSKTAIRVKNKTIHLAPEAIILAVFCLDNLSV
jgi:hypothetical protein